MASRDDIESLFSSWNLKRVETLDELAKPAIFFSDSAYSNSGDFPIYPVGKKVNLTHDLLNLYGTHWRYLANAANPEKIRRNPESMEEILRKIKENKYASYAFTKKYLEKQNSLWVFREGTLGEEFIVNIVRPIYEKDYCEYSQLKNKAK
jgi:hypothetical protein